MSLTAEMLAEEIKRLGHCAPLSSELIACDLLPFIERHIAAGQTEDALVLKALVAAGHVDQAKIDQARDIMRPLATPKPAGAVPLPEPAILSQIGRDGWTKSQVEAYGDAREAAGRAVAVPFDFARARTLIGYVIGYARATELRSLSSDACVALQDLHAMFETAPTPQQPAAEGACICDGATYAPDQRYPFIVNRACPRHGGATSAAEGAGREAVEAFERLTAMKYASDHDGYCQRLQDIAAIRRHLAQPTPAAITYSDQQRIIDLTLSEAYCAGHDGKTFDMLAATKKINAAFAHHTPAADAGGVTLAMIRRGVDAWYASTFTGGGGLHLRIAEVLTAAFTPEVSHGE